ncbi:MAG TPA: family 16 glycoside hydrolase [Steroidobacteraceae bacterium]|nr:family 16 glycoside hydrolase [Steroidobacteraceae bacterium]
MATNLPRLIPSTDPNDRVEVQNTTLGLDIVSRYHCNTWDEVLANGGAPFDVVVIGAGMFGAYCAEKIYRNGEKSLLRVLVLDAGGHLVSEHAQNLSPMDIVAPALATVRNNAEDPGTRNRVWGSPWHSNQGFTGLAYCIGGRSIHWGGWAPQLTAEDLAQWPAQIREYLTVKKTGTGIKNAAGVTPQNNYEEIEQETGVFDKTDYISGKLFEALLGKATEIAGSADLKIRIATVKAAEEAPLAVQGAAPRSGLFSFDKYSSVPILFTAVREAANGPDSARRIFVVPRAHVIRLKRSGNRVTEIDAAIDGRRVTISPDNVLSPDCQIVLALGTIETTRLALESFGTPRMGRNLMAHLRSNLTCRIKRSALKKAIDPTKPDYALPLELEAGAFLVRGSNGASRYHFQITAAALGPSSTNPEDVMFRAIPDIELLGRMLANEDPDWITITIRGIGEMTGDKNADPAAPDAATKSWINLAFDVPDQRDEFQVRRAWVNLMTSTADETLWTAMDEAAIKLARRLANVFEPATTSADLEFLHPGSGWKSNPPATFRDKIGTTHHEAGTLWMGENSADSVADLDGRFHHLDNSYVAGPALFPSIGSANPSLTALTLARKTAHAIVERLAPKVEADFTSLFDGTMNGWKMAGPGQFIVVGKTILESDGGPGLLWFAQREFENFELRLDWRVNSPLDNSGVYLRIPALGGDFHPADTEGYEVQIDERGIDENGNPGSPLHRTGAVYKLAPSTAAASNRVGAWNHYVIKAAGNKISVVLNDMPVAELQNASRRSRGFIALQNHHLGSKVQFRNIRVRA